MNIFSPTTSVLTHTFEDFSLFRKSLAGKGLAERRQGRSLGTKLSPAITNLVATPVGEAQESSPTKAVETIEQIHRVLQIRVDPKNLHLTIRVIDIETETVVREFVLGKNGEPPLDEETIGGVIVDTYG